MSEWPMMSLHEAGVQLFDCEHRTPAPTETGFPYIAIPQIKEGRLDLTNVRYISHDDFVDWTKKTCPQPWDVILSRRCNPGETAYVPPHLKCALGQNLVILRSNGSKVIPEFLRWLIRGPYWQEQVQTYINVGAVFDSLKCQDIPNFRLPIPPLPEQRAIAHILGTLDDKIELNRRMNETLEAMARAIFKSWFVDFDPVRAKAEGRDTGLPKEIADLFPDSFEETELGEVPKGWKVCGLDEIATFLNGLALQKYPPNKGNELPVIKIVQLRKGDTVGSDRCSTNIPQDYIVKNSDVLFSWSGSLECKLWTGGRGGLNQHLFKVSSDKFPKWFYYYWIHQHLPSFRHIAAGKATTMGHIQRHHLSDSKVIIPNAEVLRMSSKVIYPIFDQIIQQLIESRTLAELRDTLLPKLISGELRIDNTV